MTMRSFWLSELLKSEMARMSIVERCIEVARKAVAKQQGGRKNLSNRVSGEASSKEEGRPKRNYEEERGWGRKGEGTIEFKSIGKIRDDETRQKGPGSKKGRAY